MNIPSSIWAACCWRTKDVSASLAVLGERVLFGTCLRLFQTCTLLSLALSDYLYCLILMETSENEYRTEWVTTKFLNVNEFIVYFYWLGWFNNREQILTSLHFSYFSILLLFFYYWTPQSLCCCACVCPL